MVTGPVEMKMKRMAAPALLASLCFLAACAHTQVTESWRNPQVPGAPPGKVLVVVRLPSEAARYQLEQELVRRLPGLGMSATASSDFFPDSQAMPREEVWKTAREQG